MSNPMPGPPPIRDGETWEDYVYRCRRPGETIRQAEARLIEARPRSGYFVAARPP